MTATGIRTFRNDVPDDAGFYVIRALWGSFPVVLGVWHCRDGIMAPLKADPGFDRIQCVWEWEDELDDLIRVSLFDHGHAHRVLLRIQNDGDVATGHRVAPLSELRRRAAAPAIAAE